MYWIYSLSRYSLFAYSKSMIGHRRRSSSVLATSRAPPSFPEPTIRLAIQRRTVRMETPVSRAMSRARRYSLSLIIPGPPLEEAMVLRQGWPGRPIRARLAALKDARGRPARLRPGRRILRDLDEPGPCPPEDGNQDGREKNGAIESIFVGADPPFGCLCFGQQRNWTKAGSLKVCLLLSRSE